MASAAPLHSISLRKSSSIGLSFTKHLSRLFTEKKMQMLILSLDVAGKTAILCKLKVWRKSPPFLQMILSSDAEPKRKLKHIVMPATSYGGSWSSLCSFFSLVTRPFVTEACKEENHWPPTFWCNTSSSLGILQFPSNYCK